VALKILTPGLSDQADYRERFLRESRLAASIDHPNILPIYDAGEASGYLYIAMRLVDGTDLGAVLQSEGPLSVARAVSMLSQVSGALDAAHARGLVHRDVKPANLLVSGEHVYLTDFGVAKIGDAGRDLTRVGMFVGTIDYASPEQIRNEPLDGRADLYALACVFYQCLTGRPPFDRPTDHAVLQAHLTELPAPASSLRADLPAAIDAVLATALAKDRESRYRSGRHFAEAAHAALAGGTGPIAVRATRVDLEAPTNAPTLRAQPAWPSEAERAQTKKSPSFIPRLIVGAVVVAGVFYAANYRGISPGAASATAGATRTPQATIATPSPLTPVTPTPSPAPTHPYPVLLNADQVIMPPEQVPLAGYVVSRDQRSGAFGWTRQFYSTGANYWYLTFEVTVLRASAPATEELARTTCDWTFTGGQPLTAREIGAEVIADGAKACRYTFANNTSEWVVYTTGSRNVVVEVGVSPRLSSITTAAAAAQAVSLARLQLALIERVSPR
jgi:serine/threonine protein kinase